MSTPAAWQDPEYAARLRRYADPLGHGAGLTAPRRATLYAPIVRAIRDDINDMVQDYDGVAVVYADVLDDYFADLLPSND